MKQAFVFFISYLLTAALFAQGVTVNGRLVTAVNKSPLPYATISVAPENRPGESFRKFASKENGIFSTELEKGKYIFTFNFVGMEQVVKTIDLSSTVEIFEMGDIAMTESAKELEELSITAQRPLVKVEIDKLTYNAKDDPEASTSNVLDLLRKVPLVTVDGEDEIQLKGSSNFKIYVNGKPSNMISSNPSQVLKSMPANSVKDIEVITDPGARYDAEGVGGIINIVTDKRVDDGYSGSVGANANTFGGYGANLYLATKYGKLGFNGNASYYSHSQPESESGFTREEFTPFPLNTLTQRGTYKGNGGGLYLNGSMSFEPDTLNLFNLSVSRFGGEFNSFSHLLANSGDARPYSYISESNSANQYGGMNLSADYQRSFKKKGEMLTGSYRYEKSPNDSEYESKYDVDESIGEFYYQDGYRLKSINNAGGDEHTIQVDYVNPLNEKHFIETGLKYIFRDNSSRSDHTFYDVSENIWKPDLNRKNDLDHSQNISSGYAGYNYKAGKLGIKLGLRAEHTQQDIHFMGSDLDTIVATNFFDLVPSATLSYQLGMTKTLRGGYNMRISRPGIWHLNPYINDLDPNNISYGNPRLNSEQQHNFNINYGSFSQKFNFNVTLSYSFAKNAVTPYSFIVQDVEGGIEKSVTHNTYANIGQNHTFGTNIYAGWTPNEMISTYLNGGVNYTDIQSSRDSGLRNSGISGRAFGGLTFNLPEDFRVGANGGLFLNRIQLQTEQSPFYFYSFNLQKSFLDKKMDISLNVQNLFSEFREFSSTTRGEGFTQKSKFLNPMRNFSLSVTYRFGDLKTSVKRIQRSITNEDVMQGEEGSKQSGSTTPGGI